MSETYNDLAFGLPEASSRSDLSVASLATQPEGLSLSTADKDRVRRLAGPEGSQALRGVLVSSRFGVVGAVQALHEAFAHDDPAAVFRASQRLASIATEVNAHRLADLADKFTELGVDSWPELVDDLLEEVGKELETVLNDVDSLLE